MKNFLSRGVATAAVCVTVVMAAAPAASAAVIVGTCVKVGVVDVCVTEVGTTAVGEELYALAPGEPVNVGRVAAYLDAYRIGTRVFPCITPVLNGVEHDACAALGLERVSRTVLVPEAVIGTTAPRIVSHGSVYVCEATLRAMVDVYGEEGETIFTVCGNDLPEFVN